MPTLTLGTVLSSRSFGLTRSATPSLTLVLTFAALAPTLILRLIITVVNDTTSGPRTACSASCRLGSAYFPPRWHIAVLAFQHPHQRLFASRKGRHDRVHIRHLLRIVLCEELHQLCLCQRGSP